MSHKFMPPLSGTYNVHAHELTRGDDSGTGNVGSGGNNNNNNASGDTSGGAAWSTNLPGSSLLPAAFAKFVRQQSIQQSPPPQIEMIKCMVHFLDDTQHIFEVERSAKGQELLDLVFRHLELIEREYFALQFTEMLHNNHHHHHYGSGTLLNGGSVSSSSAPSSPSASSSGVTSYNRWLDPSKKIRKQLRFSSTPYLLHFRVKFYVSEVSRLFEEYTRYHFYLQLRKDILSGRLSGEESTLALLASYVLQSELGDYAEDEHQSGYANQYRYVPNQSTLFEAKVESLHRLHQGQTPADAEMNYLEEAKNLELYGVDLHSAKDSEGEELQIGVSANGLIVFKRAIRVNNFSWAKIVKISFKRRFFYVQLKHEGTERFDNMVGFNICSYRACKSLWKACVEQHTFFRLHTPKPLTKKFFFFFSLGSKFRYSGKTEFQTIEENKRRLTRTERIFIRNNVRHATMPATKTTDDASKHLANLRMTNNVKQNQLQQKKKKKKKSTTRGRKQKSRKTEDAANGSKFGSNGAISTSSTSSSSSSSSSSGSSSFDSPPHTPPPPPPPSSCNTSSINNCSSTQENNNKNGSSHKFDSNQTIDLSAETGTKSNGNDDNEDAAQLRLQSGAPPERPMRFVKSSILSHNHNHLQQHQHRMQSSLLSLRTMSSFGSSSSSSQQQTPPKPPSRSHKLAKNEKNKNGNNNNANNANAKDLLSASTSCDNFQGYSRRINVLNGRHDGGSGEVVGCVTMTAGSNRSRHINGIDRDMITTTTTTTTITTNTADGRNKVIGDNGDAYQYHGGDHDDDDCRDGDSYPHARRYQSRTNHHKVSSLPTTSITAYSPPTMISMPYIDQDKSTSSVSKTENENGSDSHSIKQSNDDNNNDDDNDDNNDDDDKTRGNKTKREHKFCQDLSLENDIDSPIRELIKELYDVAATESAAAAAVVDSPITTTTAEDTSEATASSPVHLVIVTMKPDGEGRFGFNVKGGFDQNCPVLVSRVAPNTPADNAFPCKLREGDQVISINGIEVAGLKHEEVVQLIRSTRDNGPDAQLSLAIQSLPNTNNQCDDEDEIDEIEEPVFQFTNTEDSPFRVIGAGGGSSRKRAPPPPPPDKSKHLSISMNLLREGLESESLLAQFEQLHRRNEKEPITISRYTENVPKNRYLDIAPYDSTRVVLEDCASGDYINASYVTMAIETSGVVNRYIATQGPLKRTTGDFWQMVWEKRCSVIVMVTPLVEDGRKKCFKYWPDDIRPCMMNEQLELSTESCVDEVAFLERRFKLKHTKTNESHYVTHIQYLAWPDQGVPDDDADFLKMIVRVRQLRVSAPDAHIVVHCSAGIGRTGVLILMETGICLIEANEPVYPLELVRRMRCQRAMLIQTTMQFRFVCEALYHVYRDHVIAPLPQYSFADVVPEPDPDYDSVPDQPIENDGGKINAADDRPSSPKVDIVEKSETETSDEVAEAKEKIEVQIDRSEEHS